MKWATWRGDVEEGVDERKDVEEHGGRRRRRRKRGQDDEYVDKGGRVKGTSKEESG